MARTTQALVIGVLRNGTEGGDYDDVHAPSLTPYIDSASLIVTRVATCATGKGVTLSTDELEMIERWLAAHLYTKSDPTYQSKSTAGASGAFVRDPTVPEPYKDGALMNDPSGCLNAILNRQRAGGFWLGRPPSEQTDYVDRD